MADDPNFVIRSIPDKGMGVVAVRPIAKGEEVLSEAPLFTQELARNRLTIWHSLASKTADEKRKFLELTNCHQQNRKIHPFLGIFETNALPCGNNGMGEIAPAAGLFFQGSRFNSSCVPNVNNYWSEEKQVITFRAIKDIAEGEELCISYKLGFEPRDSRRAQLQKAFGFECHCAACSQLGDALLISNLRRIALRSLYDEIVLCGNRPAEGVQKVKSALRLLQREGLVHNEDTFSYDAFQFCAVTSDLIHAKAWIQKAWEAACSISGEDSTAAIKFKGYIDHPETHPSWGKGQMMTLEGPDEVTGDAAHGATVEL